VKMQRTKAGLPDDLLESEKRLKLIVHRMENSIANHEFEKARFYSEEERKERETLDSLRKKYSVQNPDANIVRVEHVEEALAHWTGMTVAAIREGSLPNKPPQVKKQKNEETS
jgi:ATP-dependent Clp protease ATP-binding subunit ClpC